MNYNDGCDDCDDVVGIERKMLANLPGGPDLVDEQRLVSDAEVAEVPFFTAFTSRRKADHISSSIRSISDCGTPARHRLA
jgi:hypothetical protein